MLELDKFMLKCFLVVFIFIQVDISFGQKVVYQTIRVFKETHYLTGTLDGRIKPSTTSAWYFQEGHWPKVMVDGDGKNLRATMKGCDDCTKYLDKMAVYSKKTRNNSILGLGGLVGAVAVGILGFNVVYKNNVAFSNEAPAAEKERKKKLLVGKGIMASGGVVLGFSIYGFIKSSKIANKRWPEALQNSVTAYNAYITRLNNGEE